MKSSSLDDTALLAQIAAGQAWALSECYDRYGRLVFSLAYHIVADNGQAEDITQEVFLQIWNKAGLYRGELGSVSTWISSIARNRAIDAYRRQRIRPEAHLSDWPDGNHADIKDDWDVEHTQEMASEQRRIREAISHLPADQKRVLALAYFYGYSHQEIADLTGEPLGTVKTRLRLAMKKLKQFLADELISTG